jgi:hypothetical protein
MGVAGSDGLDDGATAKLPGAGAAGIEVIGAHALSTQLGSRGYFADECRQGSVYNRSTYLALKLLGQRLIYTVDLSGAGCGCNAALSFVPMSRNARPSFCGDYYCDANGGCGVTCAEIDVQEANRHAWHSTLHANGDYYGVAGGFGGGSKWQNPRDFTAAEYGPHGNCVNTSHPFVVTASFPADGQGRLKAMEVALSQAACSLSFKLAGYAGTADLSEVLAAGVAPVVSYWSDENLLWLDGQGPDSKGPCASDSPSRCANSIRFSGFAMVAIEDVDGPGSRGGHAPGSAIFA